MVESREFARPRGPSRRRRRSIWPPRPRGSDPPRFPSAPSRDALFLLAELLDRTSGVVANCDAPAEALAGSRTPPTPRVASDAALVHDASRAPPPSSSASRERRTTKMTMRRRRERRERRGSTIGAHRSGAWSSIEQSRRSGKRKSAAPSISARRTRLALGGAIDAASNAVAKSLDDVGVRAQGDVGR